MRLPQFPVGSYGRCVTAYSWDFCVQRRQNRAPRACHLFGIPISCHIFREMHLLFSARRVIPEMRENNREGRVLCAGLGIREHGVPWLALLASGAFLVELGSLKLDCLASELGENTYPDPEGWWVPAAVGIILPSTKSCAKIPP